MTKYKYSEKDITAFETDLEKVRARPALYIGPTDDSGIFTIIREALDNGVDEARAGRNKLVWFVHGKDGSFWIIDEGVGIPVKKHPKAKISTLTHVLVALQSSGKMNGGAYEAAIGTHGVGIKATNALSKQFEVWTYRKDAGGWHYTRFERGHEKVKPRKNKPPKVAGTRPKLGTIIHFTPDDKIFKKAVFKPKMLESWAEIKSFMNAGLTIQYTDQKGKTKKWLHKAGFKDYLAKRMQELKATPLTEKPLHYTSQKVELALHFADAEGDQVQFFTNTIANPEQGTHADGFYAAYVDVLHQYGKKREYQAKDLYEGLVGILNYNIDAPQYDSQTKEKLVDDRVTQACYDEVYEVFDSYFKKNKNLANQLIDRAVELRRQTADRLKDRKLALSVRNASKGLASKLADINNRSGVKLEDTELFIVEGDSAGGSGKVARDKAFQAIYSIRGKPLNVMDTTKDRVNANAEIAGLFAGIGLDLKAKDPISKLRFGKIIFLTDPDVDGLHINCLLLAVFWRYLPRLFKERRIYIVRSPEFMARHKDKVYFGDSKEHIYKQTGSTKIDIQHIKGWGEVEAADMEPIVFTKGIRKLYCVTDPDKQGGKDFEHLMGKGAVSVEYRQKLLNLVDLVGKTLE